jgi:hypothetical protein
MKKIKYILILSIISFAFYSGCDSPVFVAGYEPYFTSFYPEAICPNQKFYIRGQNFSKYSNDKFAVLLRGVNVKIENINDTLITCSLVGVPIGLGDYDVLASCDTLKEILGQTSSHYDSGWGLRRKLIVSNPKVISCIPAAATVGRIVRINGNCFGSNPRIVFGNAEGLIKTYQTACYGEYRYPYFSTTVSSIKKYDGYIDVEIPEGATTPIVLKSECGDIDLSSKISVIDSDIEKVQIELKNIICNFRISMSYSKDEYFVESLSDTIEAGKSLISYDAGTQTYNFFDSTYSWNGQSSNDYYQNIEIIKYSFNLQDFSLGSCYYSKSYYKVLSKRSDSEGFSTSFSFANMKKITENEKIIIYRLFGEEITGNIINFKYRKGYSHVTIGYSDFAYDKSVVDLEPQTTGSEIILTIYKK